MVENYPNAKALGYYQAEKEANAEPAFARLRRGRHPTSSTQFRINEPEGLAVALCGVEGAAGRLSRLLHCHEHKPRQLPATRETFASGGAYHFHVILRVDGGRGGRPAYAQDFGLAGEKAAGYYQ